MWLPVIAWVRVHHANHYTVKAHICWNVTSVKFKQFLWYSTNYRLTGIVLINLCIYMYMHVGWCMCVFTVHVCFLCVCVDVWSKIDCVCLIIMNNVKVTCKGKYLLGDQGWGQGEQGGGGVLDG